MAINKIIKNKIRQWEQKNIVFGKGYVDKTKGMGKSLNDNMQRRGYDVMRISPRISKVFGLNYRKVYGSQIVPNHNMPETKNRQGRTVFYPKVEWHMQGYIKATKKSGTMILNRSILSQFKKTPLKMMLMMRR